MRLLRSGYWFFSFFVAVACSPPPPSTGDTGPLGPRVDQLFSEFTVSGSPGAAAMVVQDGQVTHSAGYGLANTDRELGLTPRTPIRLGSVGKQFTSMAAMILADRGLLAFDDPVIEWVPELERFPGIQVQHLLRHTSGLPDYYDLPEETFQGVSDSDGDPVLTNRDVITIYRDWGGPLFAPGEQYRYSNPGYEVLALIVERVSGRPFGEFLAEEIFRPLDMETAVVRDRPDVEIPDRAVGYRPGRFGLGWVEEDDHFANWLVGAGGVYASLEDLYLWDQALDTDTLVSHEIRNLAFSPTMLDDGSVSDYGFGWRVGDRLGRKAVHHGGSWVGFRAAIIRFVDDATTVVVLSNASASAGDLAEGIAALVLNGNGGS
ncbi:MAG: beta-lactamase family protein [Gemmatimonadetes bacterium]|nr:beta-lactamase family protein [Gemmatimonadota bacterium]